MRAAARARFLGSIAIAASLPTIASAQVLVRQPRCTSLVVEIQSLRDEIDLVPGDLTDPPYVYRAWTRYPHVECRELWPIANLRILDRALVDENAKADADPWSIELMPAVPTSFDIRLDGGKGRFDLTGMAVQDLGVFASFSELRFQFGGVNRGVLENARITLQSGELTLRRVLDANARLVTLRLPRSKMDVELDGRPRQAGELEIVVLGRPSSVRLGVPAELPLRVEGPPPVLEAFAAASLPKLEGALESLTYRKASFRALVRFVDGADNVVVRWTKEVELPAGPRPESAPDTTAPVTAATSDPRVARVQEAIEDHQITDARAGLRELRQHDPDDPRLAVLERWLRSETRAPELSSGAGTGDSLGADYATARLLRGQQLLLVGEYSNALREFEAARGDPRHQSEAEAWIRHTRSTLERIHEPEPEAEPLQPPEPRVVVVTQTTSPVFALRTPGANRSRIRRGVLQLSGQVGDDTGLDRLEVSLNGDPLVDASGAKLQVRPAESDSAAVRIPFTIPVPLREGENEIVLTAYDADSPPHWTSEHLRVTRLPPLWRTAAAQIAALACFFAVIAWLVISRAIKSRLAFVSRYNPYVAGHPIRNSEMLFGRERLLHSILNTIHNNSIMLHGPRRMGKTSLLLNLKSRLQSSRDTEYRFVPVFVDLQGTTEDQLFPTLMHDVLDACRGIPNLPPDPARDVPYSSRDFTRDLRAVLQALQAQTRSRLKMVLLLDEVDELNHYSEPTNQKLRSVFMKSFAESLVAIMAGTHIEKRWRSEGSPWYNFFEEIEVRPLERPDAERLIRAPVRGIFTYDDDAVERILRYSEGRPYDIQRLCVHAINRVIDAKRRRVHATDIEAVRDATIEPEDTEPAGVIGGPA